MLLRWPTGHGLGVSAQLEIGMLFLSIGWRPFVLNRQSRRDATWARLHAEMLEAGGVVPGDGLDHSEAGTGIAINPRERLVLLLADGIYKSYDYEDVRKCDANRENGSSSLLVSVRDRGMPTWRIAMKDEAARARWMEILRQALSVDSMAARC